MEKPFVIIKIGDCKAQRFNYFYNIKSTSQWKDITRINNR